MVTVWQSVAVPGSFGMGTEAAPIVTRRPDRAAADAAEESPTRASTSRDAPACTLRTWPSKATGPIWETIVESRTAITRRRRMGSRGSVGLRAMFLGSVSGAVVHHAERPTLIVQPVLSGA